MLGTTSIKVWVLEPVENKKSELNWVNIEGKEPPRAVLWENLILFVLYEIKSADPLAPFPIRSFCSADAPYKDMYDEVD
jgi:hypothetical protein